MPATKSLTKLQVQRWIDDEEAVLLLRIERDEKRLTSSVRRYLDSAAGVEAKEAYKCRVRDPWWWVPDVRVPDGFLTVMSGDTPQIIRNEVGCAATNSLHVVRMREGESFQAMQAGFASALTRLSCEIEGHPLGGGLLKIEPREAQRVLVPAATTREALLRADESLQRGIIKMREWRGHE